MIAEFLNREIVRQQLALMSQDLKNQLDKAVQGGPAVPADEAALMPDLSATQSREDAQSSGQPGYQPPAARRGQRPPPLDDYVFLSRDPLVSLLQSALDEYAVEHAGMVESQPPDDDRRGPNQEVIITAQRLAKAPPPRRTPDGRRLFDKYSVTDIRWVRSVMARGVRKWRGKHAFNSQPAKPVELPARARLVLVGDWGSGLPRAQKVARQMRAVLDQGKAQQLVQHVIHLGDVYYSGWPKEYQRRFLPHWPVPATEAGEIGSWSTNSNHDMYCGGHGYFDTLLSDARFALQEKSSFFSFVHPHWNIAALDTAWTEGELEDPQLTWLQDLLRDRSRKAVLLSHHQLFSAFEKDSAKLKLQLEPLLAENPVKAWFWGHEHRCVLYKPHGHIDFARCVGHGGVPVYMWRGKDDAYPPPAAYEYRDALQRGLERWALFGFAVLDFDGPQIDVRYIDENGREHHVEQIA